MDHGVYEVGGQFWLFRKAVRYVAIPLELDGVCERYTREARSEAPGIDAQQELTRFAVVIIFVVKFFAQAVRVVVVVGIERNDVFGEFCFDIQRFVEGEYLRCKGHDVWR